MEEAMLIIFLGTSMKSHSAAPMAAAAAAGWLAAGVPGSKAVDDDYSLNSWFRSVPPAVDGSNQIRILPIKTSSILLYNLEQFIFSYRSNPISIGITQ